jgi:hypothetical protein
MAKTKSKKQVGYLLSSGSPLSAKQKAKLKGELHSGAVKVMKGKKKMAKKGKKGKMTFDKMRAKVFGLKK